jgi:hypothetical protein
MDRGVFVRMDEVASRPVSWLWPGRLPLGKLTLLAGDPGLGKSFFTTWLAARVSRCDDFPDGKNGLRKPGDVLILSAEDDASDTIRPRLEMHGADLRRVQVLQSVQQGDRTRTVSVDLDKHMPVLEQWLQEADRPRLIVVDPITAYMGETDANSNAEVRSLLGDLAMLAAAKGVAVVCVSHLNKGSPNAKTVYRTIGSLAFTAAARVVYSVTAGAHEGEERMVLVVKSNLDMKSGGMSYRPVALSWPAGGDVPLSLSALGQTQCRLSFASGAWIWHSCPAAPSSQSRTRWHGSATDLRICAHAVDAAEQHSRKIFALATPALAATCATRPPPIGAFVRATAKSLNSDNLYVTTAASDR